MHYNTHNPPLCNTVMLRNVLRAQVSVKLEPGALQIGLLLLSSQMDTFWSWKQAEMKTRSTEP